MNAIEKKDKVVFCDTIMPSAGSVGAADLGCHYWSPSVNSLEGKRAGIEGGQFAEFVFLYFCEAADEFNREKNYCVFK